jgi:transposase
MAKSYGDDLRRKLLQAHDRGEGTLEQLAARFSVSVPWAWKISAQRKRTGQTERIEQRRGTVRKVTAEVEQRLRGWVQAQPDLTLAEFPAEAGEGLPSAGQHRTVVAGAAADGSPAEKKSLHATGKPPTL